MAEKGRKAMLDYIGLEPGSFYFRNLDIKLKNGISKGFSSGNWCTSLPVTFEGLSSHKIQKVAFQKVNIGSGLQYYCGMKIHDDKGNEIASHDGGRGEWIEYELDNDEYIQGIYGQMNTYFNYVVKIGLITNKEKVYI